MTPATLHGLFEAQVARTPTAVAIRGDSQTLTYQELDESANQLAHHLRQLGVGATTIVGLSLDRDADLVVTMLAILKSGGACVPLDPQNPSERLELMLANARVQSVITQGSLRGRFAGIANVTPIVVERTHVRDQPKKPPPTTDVTAGNTAVVLYTSGSTGRPKGVVLTHSNLGGRSLALQNEIPLGVGDVVLHLFPFAFIAGMGSLWWPLIGGGTVIIPPSLRDVDRLVALAEEGVTMLRGTPMIIEGILDHPRVHRLTSIRTVVCTGQALRGELVQKAKRLPQCTTFYNAYGQTETGPSSLLMKFDMATIGDAPPRICLGSPVANMTVHILDQEMQPVPVGVRAELCLSGDGVARGYINDPEQTAARFRDNPFATDEDVKKGWTRLYKTGDLVCRLPDGNLEFCGRLDDQLKIRETRVEPAEIVEVLESVSAVADAVVTLRETWFGREQLVAYVTTTAKLSSAEAATMRQRLRDAAASRLPEYMVPAGFVFLDRFPRNTNGKLDKQALPAPSRAEMMDNDYVPPRTDVERRLVEILQEVLNVTPGAIGVMDEYARLGGDSMMFLRVVSRARACGIPLTPESIYSNQTIEQLATTAARSAPIPAASSEPDPTRVLELPLLYIQNALLAARASQKGKAMSVLLRSTERLEPDRLEAALQEITARHEILRSSIVGDDGDFRLQVRPYHHEPILKSRSIPSGSLDERIRAIRAECWRLVATVDRSGDHPLVIALFEGDGEQWLFAALSTALADDATMHILIEDLRCAYLGKPLAPTTPYHVWVKACQTFAASPAWEEEREFWEAQLRKVTPVPVRPAIETEKRLAREEFIAAPWVDGLVAAQTAGQGDIHEIMLAAWARVMARRYASPGISMRMCVHGREVLGPGCEDIGQTMGPLSVRFPLYLELDPTDQIRALAQTRDALRSVPRRGVGFWMFQQFRPEWREVLPWSDLPCTQSYLLGVPPVFVYEGKVDFRQWGWDAPVPQEALMAGNERSSATEESGNLTHHTPKLRTMWGDPTLRCSTIRSMDKTFLKIRCVTFRSLHSSDELEALFTNYIDELKAWSDTFARTRSEENGSRTGGTSTRISS